VTTTKEELLHYFKQMYTMRRMEIVNDTEYKVRLIQTAAQPTSLLISHLPLTTTLTPRPETSAVSATCMTARRPLLPACTPP